MSASQAEGRVFKSRTPHLCKVKIKKQSRTKNMIKKLDLKVNEKGEITSPTYPELVSKINELIEKSNTEDLR